jgi:hypothetical protein
MTDSFWPALGLDESATETEIRRAYAKRLREQGPDADVASFQALRAEFEAALTAVRSAPATYATRRPEPSLATQRVTVEPAVRVLEATAPPREQPARTRDSARVPERSSSAVEEIERLLAGGELLRACERFDLARASNEIDFGAESGIELALARNWLTDATLDAAALAAIVRKHRWDDVLSDFPLGPQIVARLHAITVPVRKPGERFIGQWNWGAFCLSPFWLMAHGLAQRGIGLLLLGAVALVVPLGPILLFWIAFRCGRRGNALAVKHRTFADDEQFIAVQNAWRNWGLSLCAGTAACLVLLMAVGAHR